MSDTTPSTAAVPDRGEPASTSPVAELNARTARRQKLLMGAIGALVLVGGSWFTLGGDEKAGSDDPDAAQTIDTAGIVNRDLANREFVATYSNRIDAVTREQKALRDASVPRSEIEEQLAALKAENHAMRTDGQAAIDAISAENAELRTRLATQSSAPAPAARPPEETRQNVQLYLKAVEASVEALGREGRTVLVAEAVVSGSAPDLTESVRADVARRVAGVRHAQP